VLGICTTLGSATPTARFLARTLGIPAVVGRLEGIELDNGTSWHLREWKGMVNPEPDTLGTQAKQDVRIAAQQQASYGSTSSCYP